MWRPFVLYRVFLLLCAMAVCWGTDVSAAGADAKPGVYLALGDSLAAGFGANPPGDAYVPRVFAYLRAAGRPRVDRVVNLGFSGETTSSFLAGQLGQALQVINDPSIDVRYVTLDIGANDILGNPQCFASPLSCPIEANLTAILTALSGALAHEPGKARIALLAYYNPYSGVPNPLADPGNVALLGTDGRIDCGASGAAIGLNDIIACTGRLFGARLADAYALFRGHARQLVLPGDVHPNNAGYGVLARLFIHALSR